MTVERIFACAGFIIALCWIIACNDLIISGRRALLDAIAARIRREPGLSRDRAGEMFGAMWVILTVAMLVALGSLLLNEN